MKWHVIATEGATTDGRHIERRWIAEMAENYDPKKYGARVNLEHIKFSYFHPNEAHSRCYGDVIALKAEENADGKLQLLAQIDPTDELKALNQARQKLYTSVEIDPNFADTNQAYLVGLAVTDSPASLGTEILTFSSQAKQNPFLARKQKAENLFSECVETEFSFEEPKATVLDKIKALFSTEENANPKAENMNFKQEHEAAILGMGKLIQTLSEKSAVLEKQVLELCKKVTGLETSKAEAEAKFKKLEETPIFNNRPQATGENTANDFIF